MICYFISDLCLQDVNRLSKGTKYWLHMQEYQADKFLSPKEPIKFSPHSQLLQNPKGDYYSNVMMQFKHYLPSKLCYYSSFDDLYDITKITDNFNVHFSTFLAYKVDPLLFTGRNIHLRLVPSMSYVFST